MSRLMLDLDLSDEESLWTEYARRLNGRTPAKLQITIRLMRQGAQSLGESSCTISLWTQHLPEPLLQFHVYDDLGNLVGITDFAWPRVRTAWRVRRHDQVRPAAQAGESPGDAVVREKNREDRLREVTGG